MPEPWPWPADDALTRARHVGREYRQRLMEANPDACAELDGLMARFGQTWVKGVDVPDEHVLTTSEAADYLAMTPRGVRAAVQRGGLVAAGRDADGYVFLRNDLINFLRTRRGGGIAERQRSAVPS